MTNIILPIALASAAGILGGIVAIFWKRQKHWRGYLLHFTAGLLTGVIAADMLPEILQNGDPLPAIGSFIAGSAMVIVLQYFSVKVKKARPGDKEPYGLGISAGIDTGIDGMIISAGFASSGELGTLLTIVLGLELFVLTLSVSEEFHLQGASKKKTMVTAAAIALMLPLGAAFGYWLLSNFTEQDLANVLAFAVAALLFLAVEELLSKGHEVEQTPLTTLSFLLGFLVLFGFHLYSR